MKNILKTIENASDIFMQGHVVLNNEKIKKFRIKGTDRISHFFKPPMYLNSLYKTLPKKEVYKIIHAYNAINASLQYSFFLGNAKTRFDGIDSFWVMSVLDDIFKDANIKNVNEIILLRSKILKALINSNITLLDTRVKTINEVFDTLDFVKYGKNYLHIKKSLKMLQQLVCFKQDIFFKKGLFAIMISNRMMPKLINNKSYKDQLFMLPVPADYQIPKMLRHFGLIEMSKELSLLIDSNEILIENSEMELNIRAATIKACRIIAKNNNISVDDVDAYFFMLRKETNINHHLCVTTSY
jgi:hypothetical protein